MGKLLIAMPGGWEWAIVGLVVILFFGAKKIPGLARGIGKGIKEFKDGKNGISDDVTDKSES